SIHGFWAALLPLFLCVGCIGDSAKNTTEAEPGLRKIEGFVTLSGPLKGATVDLYDATSRPSGLIGSAVTDEEGYWSIDLNSEFRGLFLEARVSGGISENVGAGISQECGSECLYGIYQPSTDSLSLSPLSSIRYFTFRSLMNEEGPSQAYA